MGVAHRVKPALFLKMKLYFHGIEISSGDKLQSDSANPHLRFDRSATAPRREKGRHGRLRS